MLFQEIPADFKTRILSYFIKIYSNIEKKNNQLLLNNILAPASIKTDHMKLEIGSDQHIKVMTELFYLLHIFHQYAQSNHILYTISSGNLLGYHSSGDVLLWDDDIDIIVIKNHFKIIKDLWDNGGQSYKIWDNNWSYKNIFLDSHNIILLRLRNQDFFKIKLNTNNIKKCGLHQRDIGGVDICTINWTLQGGQSKPLPKHIVNTIFNPNNETEEDYPIVKYGTVETRILRQDLAITLLDVMYPRWREMKHPALF